MTAPPEPARWTRVLAGWAVLVVAVAALAGAATVRVDRNATIDTAFAERVALTHKFEVVETRVATVLLGRPAVGTSDAPAEITEGLTPASTELEKGEWTYTVALVEREAESAASGAYVVELRHDARLVGAVHLVQNVSNPLAPEGARITFGLGPERPVGPMFAVLVRQEAVGGFTLKSVLDASVPPQPRWRGEGGSISGQTNPTLTGRAGEEMTIKVVNGDSGFHNFRILSGGTTVAGPTPDIDELNEEQVLDWTPSSSGSYSYRCDYHDTMVGSITISRP